MIRLFASTYPDRAYETNTWAASDRDEGARRWVAAAHATSGVIGYGSIWRVRLDKFRMDLMIDPDWRRRGIATEMLAQLCEAARGAGAATLQARAETDDGGSLAFLGRHGFGETMRMQRLLLRICDANLAPLAGREAELAAHGIQITTLGCEQLDDPECWNKLCDLYNAARNGWPDPDPGPEEPLDADAVCNLVGRFESDGEAFFVAKQADKYLGFTGGMGTGVRPAARNQGIATALKLRAIARARDRGETTMRSASGNPAMLRLNEKLGYKRTATEVRLVRRLYANPGHIQE